MAFSIISNNKAGRDARVPAPQLREDGTTYPWRLYYDNFQHIVDADTPTECVAAIIPGYLALDEEGRFQARLSYVRGVQQNLRARLLQHITLEEWDELEEWEQNVLSHLIGDAYGWGDGTNGWTEPVEQQPEDVDMWKASKPLVLVEGAYQPLGPLRRPLSSEGDYRYVKNLVWLTARDDEAMLHAISSTGYLSFGTPNRYYSSN